jgi:trehalose 6-phosphate phosphatase
MMHVLLPENREPLEQFARSRLLVAFDYDGTLAPITTNPAHAPMRDRTVELLNELCRRYPCVVITGRARDDVQRFVEGAALRAIAGNHGAELPGVEAPGKELVTEWREELHRELSGFAGVLVEDKTLSLAVHYRGASDKEAARVAIYRAVEALEAVRVVGGKDVVNLVPKGARHKGFALDELRRAETCDAAVYVGDDETDEDVFRMRRALRLLTVRVGESGASHAEYFIRTQYEVDDFIAALLELRPG